MKAVDINQTIFIPVVDETHGGVTVEMKMTVGEFFRKFCKGFEPQIVEALPVEWLYKKREQMIDAAQNTPEQAIACVLWMWQKEQEAR